jgi:DNA-directed RNA polymerase subunit RPC12/RpoP
MTTYRCARCGEEFINNWSEEEAEAEYERLFGRPLDRDRAVVLCDDCHHLMLRQGRRVDP